MRKPLVLPNGISSLFTQLEINTVENLLNNRTIQSNSIIEIQLFEEEIHYYIDYARVRNINCSTKELRKILKDNKIITLIIFEVAYFYSATISIEKLRDKKGQINK